MPIAMPEVSNRPILFLADCRDKAAMFSSIKRILLTLFLLSIAGCASLMTTVTSQMADDLASSILNSDDIDTVREGVPAYLLLLDSFLRSSPDSESLLLAAARLNGSFSVLVEDSERARLLNNKAMSYALKAACSSGSVLCHARAMEFDSYQAVIRGLGSDDVPLAYAVGVAWVGWIQANSDDWAAVAELGKAKELMQRVIELDENHDYGGPHLYMGGMETLLPANMGGHPEKGRQHFEKALAINDSYLMTKVIYAEQYARLVFDQALHDRLLNEVLAADPVSEGMTLTNRIAQERAKDLLTSSAEYF